MKYESHIEGYIDPSELLMPNRASTFFVHVKEGGEGVDGVCVGDVLVVDYSLPARKGSLVVVEVDGQLTVKRLRGHQLRLADAEPPASEEKLFGVVTFIIRKPAQPFGGASDDEWPEYINFNESEGA